MAEMEVSSLSNLFLSQSTSSKAPEETKLSIYCGASSAGLMRSQSTACKAPQDGQTKGVRSVAQAVTCQLHSCQWLQERSSLPLCKIAAGRSHRMACTAAKGLFIKAELCFTDKRVANCSFLTVLAHACISNQRTSMLTLVVIGNNLLAAAELFILVG